MILYVNGDSHTAAAEAVNNHGCACDDKLYWYLEKRPHPDNLAVSWGKLLSEKLKSKFICDAESASSNQRILRTTREWIKQNSKDLYRTIVIIQWSTWEREEWTIGDDILQVTASGTDSMPESHVEIYKNWIANLDQKQKTIEAHDMIWNFHNELKQQNIKHVFFNGNRFFNTYEGITIQDWGINYLGPYDNDSTYASILSQNNFETVSPQSWHYGADAHSWWAKFILKYIVDNKLV